MSKQMNVMNERLNEGTKKKKTNGRAKERTNEQTDKLMNEAL